jgi:hypothetical protein
MFTATFLCGATFDFILYFVMPQFKFFLLCLLKPLTYQFCNLFIDPLDCAFGNGQILSRDFGGVSFVLLVEGVEMGQQHVDQSPINGVTRVCLLQVSGEFQVQLIDL